MSLFTKMYENLQPQDSNKTESEKLILSPVASPAKTLAVRVNELVSAIVKGMLPDPVYGVKCTESLAKLSPDGYWQKMCGGYCQSLMFPGEQGEDSEAFCQTWPRWGIVLDGVATELVMLEHRSKGTGCSLWPTPDCSDRRSAKCNQKGLSNIVKMWPTPAAQDGKNSSFPPSQLHRDTVPGAIMRNWATPASADCSGSSGGSQHSSLRSDIRLVKNSTDVKGQLNADWVECLMSFPIGLTDVNCNEPQEWPGWPAPLDINQMWGTHTVSGSVRSKSYIRDGVTPSEFVALKMESGQYDYEPSRVITGQKNRAKRLKCIGNAVVPQQIYPILAAIAEIERNK